MQKSLAIFLALLLWLVVILNWVDLAYRFNGGPAGLDWLLHFLGGIWVAGMIYGLQTRYHLGKLFPIPSPLAVIFIVMAVGLGWELMELIADQFIIDKRWALQGDPVDTAVDLFFDFAGATIFVGIWSRLQKNERPSLLEAAKSSEAKFG